MPAPEEGCQLSVVRIPERSFRSSFFPLLKLYWQLGKYDVVITQQDGYATFVFSFLNSLLKRKKCKHYVNEFITREKSAGFYSYIKYLFLKFSLSSVHCIMCSSKSEIEYYKKALGLRNARFEFVPLATNPKFVKVKSDLVGDYIISSGRTGRDYRTLLEAVKDLPVRLVLVADYSNLIGIQLPKNVEVKYNIPLSELICLTASARFVVLSLQERAISVGQSVLLESMALGKAVIVTKNACIVDYVKDGETSIFVSPGNSEDMKRAIALLLQDPKKAAQIGTKAKKVVESHFLVSEKIARICSMIKKSKASAK